MKLRRVAGGDPRNVSKEAYFRLIADHRQISRFQRCDAPIIIEKLIP
jgi:hypothetical protein